MALKLFLRSQDPLEEELARTRHELLNAQTKLSVEQRRSTELGTRLEQAEAELRRSANGVDIYAFEDDDDLCLAFDAFINQPDPHLDKVRSFLLG